MKENIFIIKSQIEFLVKERDTYRNYQDNADKAFCIVSQFDNLICNLENALKILCTIHNYYY